MPGISSRILYSKNDLYLIADEVDKYFFHDEPNGWCLVLGSIVPTKNPAQIIFRRFFSKIKDFIEGFDGIFLVVIFDKKTGEIHIINDVLGLMHAYYTLGIDGFCLSDSLTNILQFVGNTEIDLSSLNLYLTFQYLPNPYTMFKNIYQVPLSSMITYSKGVLKQNSYKELSKRKKFHFESDPKIIRDLLVRSLEKQISGNKKNIGAFLSGGMDTSSAIAVLTSEFGIKPIAFTAGFEDKNYDETYYAKIVAKYFGLKHEIIQVDEEDVYSLPEIASLYENPIADRAVLAEYVVCKKINSSGIKFMISGEGGDEVLGFPRNLPNNIMFSNKLINDNNALAKYYDSLTSLFPENMRKQILLSKNFKKENYLGRLYKEFGSKSPFEKILLGQWKTWLIDNVLMKDTRLFKYFGFQFVSPYIDKDLIKYISCLPIKSKMYGLRNKNYLKSVMKNSLPIETIQRKKHRFHLPMEIWFQGNMYDFIYENLISKGSFTTRYFDKRIVQKIISDHKIGKNDFNRPIWSLLFLEFWYRGVQKKTLELNKYET